MNKRDAMRQAHDLVAQMIDGCLTQITRPEIDEKIDEALLVLQAYHEKRGVWPDAADEAPAPDPRSAYCSCACGDAKYKHVVENGGKGPYAMPAFRCGRCSGTGIPTSLEGRND